MSKRLPACMCLLFAVALLSACGNKGDLFLPEDPQLSEDLNSLGQSGEVTDGVSDETSDEAGEEAGDEVIEGVPDGQTFDDDPARSDDTDKRTRNKEAPSLPAQ